VGGTVGATSSTGLGTGTVSFFDSTSATVPSSFTALTTGAVLINGVDVGAITATTSAVLRGAQVAAAINAVSAQTNVTATSDATGLVKLSGAVISTTFTGTGTAANTGLAVDGGGTLTADASSRVWLSRSSVKLQSASVSGISVAGLTSTAAASAGLAEGATAATTTAGAGVSALDLTTATGAQAALATVDSAINTINSTRAALGAYQARFVSVVASLATTAENLTASRSRVQDADFAAETAALSRAQILQQAGTAMVAQANQLPQGVMALLRQ